MDAPELIRHPFDALYDEGSRILILGSFPSVKSREESFFYAHPQNRFWRVLAAVTGESVPADIEEKRAFLHRKHIALWDVIKSCTICGSADSAIKNVTPNDIGKILSAAKIEAIFTNGKTAERYYNKYILPQTGIECHTLPSTSPANAAWSFERLCGAWKNALGAYLGAGK